MTKKHTMTKGKLQSKACRKVVWKTYKHTCIGMYMLRSPAMKLYLNPGLGSFANLMLLPQ